METRKGYELGQATMQKMALDKEAFIGNLLTRGLGKLPGVVKGLAGKMPGAAQQMGGKLKDSATNAMTGYRRLGQNIVRDVPSMPRVYRMEGGGLKGVKAVKKNLLNNQYGLKQGLAPYAKDMRNAAAVAGGAAAMGAGAAVGNNEYKRRQKAMLEQQYDPYAQYYA